MTGADDPGGRRGQIDPRAQARRELAVARLLGQGVAREQRLLGELDSPPGRIVDLPPPAEVGDEETDLAGADGFRQLSGDDINRSDGRRSLYGGEQGVQVQR